MNEKNSFVKKIGLEEILAILATAERDAMPPEVEEDTVSEIAEASTPVVTFDEPVKLKNGKYGLKISRKSNFILSTPVKALNSAGAEFEILGLVKQSDGISRWKCWIGAGNFYADKYFYIPCQAPKEKVTESPKARISAEKAVKILEDLIGIKVELV